MTEIIYIEFDKQNFENIVVCEKWLRRHQEYDSLLQNKKWKLKTLARSVFISPEPRAVFRWFAGTVPYVKSITIERPDQGVLIMKNDSSEYWIDADLPPRSREYQLKIKDQEAARQKRDEKRLAKEKERTQKKRKRTKKSGNQDAFLEPTQPVPYRGGGKIKPSVGKKKNTKKQKMVPKEPSEELPPFELTEAEEQQLEALKEERGETTQVL